MQYELIRKTQKSMLRVRDGATAKGLRTLAGIIRTLAETEPMDLVIRIDIDDRSREPGMRFVRHVRRAVRGLNTSIHVDESANEGTRAANGNAGVRTAGGGGSEAPALRLSISAG